MRRHPIIGITADYQEEVNCYSKYPWFALRKHYTYCLEILECIPIIIPITKNLQNLDFLDGLLISGGDFDIDPIFYGQKIESNKLILPGYIDPKRLHIIFFNNEIINKMGKYPWKVRPQN